MAHDFLNIVQVNTTDLGGGAAKVAWNLFTAFRNQRHKSSFIVGTKKSNDRDVYQIPCTAWESANFYCEDLVSRLSGKIRGIWRLKPFFHNLAHPGNYLNRRYGHEEFCYPASKKILKIAGIEAPDIIHFHNLHGGYFDLRLLPIFSNKIPTVITLHDAWPLSGHCAHAFDCERWKLGCGKCPSLSVYPAIQQDATALNWKKKKRIYADSKLFLVTPCDWLMKRVEQSMLAPGIIASKVIYNGIDTNIFKPAKKNFARKQLGLPSDAIILLFVAHCARNNPWKDYASFKRVVIKLGSVLYPKKVLGVCLGDGGLTESLGDAKMIFIDYVNDSAAVAQYYQASDLYIHATKADTFPNSILEALACGTPVIATAIGGIPEQIRSIDAFDASLTTGALVNGGDVEAMVQNAKFILENATVYNSLAINAVNDVSKRFNLDAQVASYLNFYHDIINKSDNKNVFHQPD